MALMVCAEGVVEGTEHIHITLPIGDLACQDEDGAWRNPGRGSSAPSFQVQSIGSKGWAMAWWPGSLALSSDEPGQRNQKREQYTRGTANTIVDRVGLRIPFQRAGVPGSCLPGNLFASEKGR